MKNRSSWVLGAAALLVACGAAAAREDPKKGEAETAAAIDAALAGSHRSEANRARDQYRHPKETLLFFGLRPDMKVVEIWPGGGWYTEVLAPVLRDKGTLYAAHNDPKPEPGRSLVAYKEKLAGNAALYDKVVVTAFGPNAHEIAPPGSLDMVVTFRNMHNWMGRDWAPQAFADMYKALKPGGILGIAEHRGNPKVEQDPKAKSGYVNEDYAIKLIEGAGFKLVARSDVNNNPKDTKDHPGGVWNLPPNLRDVADADKPKYQAIGESDRFTLKFVKPEE
jgi:predicted methyltransferase